MKIKISLMSRMQVISILLLFIALAVVGCKSKKDPETRSDLDAANDRIQALLLNIATLTKENKQLHERSSKNSKSLVAAHEKEKQTIRATARQKVAVLDSLIAELRMQLSVSERQRLALQEAVDQPGRLKILQDNNFSMERIVWIILIFLCILAAVMLGMKYFDLRRRRRENIVRIIAELAHNTQLHE